MYSIRFGGGLVGSGYASSLFQVST